MLAVLAMKVVYLLILERVCNVCDIVPVCILFYFIFFLHLHAPKLTVKARAIRLSAITRRCCAAAALHFALW